jgi:hypothetical protein
LDDVIRGDSLLVEGLYGIFFSENFLYVSTGVNFGALFGGSLGETLGVLYGVRNLPEFFEKFSENFHLVLVVLSLAGELDGAARVEVGGRVNPADVYTGSLGGCDRQKNVRSCDLILAGKF